VVHFKYRPVGLYSVETEKLLVNQIRGEDTRKTILDVSLALFSQNGFDATSVAQICLGAQVSKGAFYHHFSSKQELFLALMESWLAAVDGLSRLAGDSAETAPQALENMAAISGGLFDALEGGFPILLEFWTQASRHPAVWEKAVAPYQRYLDYFTGMMQAGIDEGSFDPTLDPEQAARILTSVVMGLLLQATFDAGGAQWQEVTRVGIEMFINGMRSKS
jgi:AcrR family transcriptional regulator